ncbi:ABC-three component system protein [Corallincola spongiicola]|uniref:ABC-three component systems C-terminal domain-containing protein n=1 Tax=Corallincola spongiicola TaxID=2520508 RepID=A0ABY1WLV1_9GAMM|nr:ABC-three component system protein [Corallincola spongiicola]TAA41801.1 hypothetical protein EXY25_16325 [Corallincola spongiicola]
MGKGSKARSYKPSTVRRLDILSGNECAAPDCSNQLVARDEKSIISKICHIEAASEEGPRFNDLMSDDDRRAYDNLILLCDECHIIIDNKDNEDDFPVSLLKEWKYEHEKKNLVSAEKNSSALRHVIRAISDTDFESDNEVEESNSNNDKFKIPDKIEHNCVKRHCSIINEYRVFFGKLNSLYKELEDNGSIRKNRLLRNVRNIYVKVKGSYVLDSKDPISVVRNNADEIFDEVQEHLMVMIGNRLDIDREDIFFAVSVVMVDGFMRCKILEEPSKK